MEPVKFLGFVIGHRTVDQNGSPTYYDFVDGGTLATEFTKMTLITWPIFGINRPAFIVDEAGDHRVRTLNPDNFYARYIDVGLILADAPYELRRIYRGGPLETGVSLVHDELDVAAYTTLVFGGEFTCADYTICKSKLRRFIRCFYSNVIGVI